MAQTTGRHISAINTPQLRTAPAIGSTASRVPNGNPNTRFIAGK